MNLSAWSIEPPVAYVAFAGLLYWLGGQRRRPRRYDGLATASFIAGLATIVLALDSPIDAAANQLFWAHMLQHVLLLTVAPPLILLGRPWPRMWSALPLGSRARLGHGLARARAGAPLRALARPLPAWILFNATILLWHLPGAYDATLRYNAVHQLEHATFFFSGLLFWARVIDPGPLRPKLDWPGRIVYAVGAMVVSWLLAVILVLVPHPLYAHYAQELTRPGGISALSDQQLAGGVMWVLGSISYSVAAIIGFYRWLEPAAAAGRARTPAIPT
jgi:cytochrome c oxidase assembly factor CtaG